MVPVRNPQRKKVLCHILLPGSTQMVGAYGSSEVVTVVPLSPQVMCPKEDFALFTELTFEGISRISLWVSSANFGCL